MNKQPIHAQDVVVLIPCLNEENAVGKVIRGFKDLGIKEIIVSDSGSKDNTIAIAQKSGAKVFKSVMGKGNNLRKLLENITISEKKYYVMVDGDNTYLPEELPSMLSKATSTDVVMGRRPLLAQNHRNTKEFLKNILHIIGNLIISISGSILYLTPTRDICTGYWIFSGSALKKMRPKLSAKRFELEADLFSTASKMGLKIAKVRIQYMKRIGESKLRFSDAFTIIKKLVTNRFSE